MKLPWQQTGATPQAAADSESGPQPCPTLGHALEALFRQKDKPEILDLGPLCGDTLVYLADRGARVAVEEIEVPPPPPDAADAEPEPVRIDQPTGRFDLVLAWEQLDFVDDARMESFVEELKRLLAPGGRLLLIALLASNTGLDPKPAQGRPARYRVTGDDHVQREETPGEALPRYCRPTRDIERALAPLSVEKLHLHRNQTREFLAVRPVPRAPKD